jgi:hypothetical protein
MNLASRVTSNGARGWRKTWPPGDVHLQNVRGARAHQDPVTRDPGRKENFPWLNRQGNHLTDLAFRPAGGFTA